MPSVLGLECKMYRNTATNASPTWNEITNITDAKLAMSKGESNVTIRGSAWELIRATLKKAEITFSMVWDTADEDFTAIRTSFLNNTQLEYLILDGPYDTTGSQGLRAFCDVLNFERDEKLTEAVMVNVTIKPAYNAGGTSGAFVAPSWFSAS